MKGKNIPVALTWEEVEHAIQVGCRRQVDSLKRGLRDSHGFEGDGFGIHVDGAAGEIAFAKAANRYYGGDVGVFKAPDVGSVQVRTRSGIGGREDLIVRAGDADHEAFVLVVGKLPRFVVVGWLRGGGAKDERFKKTYGGRTAAFFVPQSELLPFPIRGLAPPNAAQAAA